MVIFLELIYLSYMQTNEDPLPEVYLCQVNNHVSCGACCGLYNVSNLSQQKLEQLLTDRTGTFRKLPRMAEAIEAFERQIQGWTPVARPYPHFHHCAFIGWVDPGDKRVGCMLHPDAYGNHGQDWRHLSFYGAKACKRYLCPSARYLPARYLKIVQRVVDHWYLYGLIITERHFLAAVFEEIEARLKRNLDPAEIEYGSKSANQLLEIIKLKLYWPYGLTNPKGPCNYFYENGEYQRPPLANTYARQVPPRRAIILRELDSFFPSQSIFKEAKKKVARMIVQFIQALGQPIAADWVKPSESTIEKRP